MGILKYIKISDIRWEGELAESNRDLDDDYPPIIVEDMGHYYDLIDGYHRLGTAINMDMTHIKAIVISDEEAELSYGIMPKEDWIANVQDNFEEE